MNTGSAASRRLPPGRFRSDEGTAFVEFALALPIFLWLMTAMLEYGFAWRQENLVESAVLSATRTDTQLAKNRFADFEALQSLNSSLNGLKRTQVEKIVIWKANTTKDDPPATCLTASSSGSSCNLYTEAMMKTTTPSGFPSGSSTSPSCSGAWDAAWCPLGRNNAEGSGDYLGVYVQVKYTSFSGLVPNRTITIKQSAVYRLEPPFVGS